MINVTRSFLPKIEDYNEYVRGIWDRRQLTNSGPLVRELEEQIQKRIGNSQFSLVSNGTIAIQLFINQLQLKGEIITTPFSYVATLNSIIWEKCKPVFADIDPVTWCISPQEIEKKITNKTCAILGVHVFGVPCDVQAISKISEKHKIPVIYDAAHAFGVELDGKCISRYGDASTFSFHATKIFQMIEGGGIACNNKDLFDKVNLARIFGHVHEEYYFCGINAKLSEMHAAMGLCNLPHLDSIMERYKSLSEIYDSRLPKSVLRPKLQFKWKHNHSYYPILLPSSQKREEVIGALKRENIFPRKYFYPSLNTLPYLEEQVACPVSEDISSRVLCLPLFYDLAVSSVERISSIVYSSMEKKAEVSL